MLAHIDLDKKERSNAYALFQVDLSMSTATQFASP
jgi:hypothetical protein